MRKTIFITIFQAVEAKNILRTPILTTLLADPEVCLVLLTDSEDKVNYHKKEFHSERFTYEVIPHIFPKGLDKFFSWLKGVGFDVFGLNPENCLFFLLDLHV